MRTDTVYREGIQFAQRANAGVRAVPEIHNVTELPGDAVKAVKEVEIRREK